MPDPEKPRWGRALARFDAGFTRWETWLCTAVLALEIVALGLWVMLKGLSTSPHAASAAGFVLRGLLGAVVLGGVAYWALNRRRPVLARVLSVVGVLAGLASARLWGELGVVWSSNLLNWFQQASTLTLLGGLRGVGTRLTLLLALVGGSLATASGKHVSIDLVTRVVRPRLRVPLVVAGWLGAALICASAAWGFFDHIAIEDFGTPAEARPTQKIAQVGRGISEQLFIGRKQLALDVRTLPHVLRGERYADWLKGREWNAWLDQAGFTERYGAEQKRKLEVPEGATLSPIVIVPDRGEARGELIKLTNLVFPIGLALLALRFVLLALLVLAGQRTVDPEAHALPPGTPSES